MGMLIGTKRALLGAAPAAIPNILLTSLVAYYQLDEANGVAIDVHAGLNLADNNTVGTGAGVINTSRDFIRVNLENFTVASDSFNFQDTDFSVSIWVLPDDSVIGAYIGFGSAFSNNNLPWYLGVEDDAGLKWEFIMSSGIGNFDRLRSTVAYATGSFVHFVITHDATANLMSISTNDSVPDTMVHANGGVDKAGESMFVGRRPNGGIYFDGRIDEIGIWNRTLTAAEITALFNGGAGLAYSNFQ